MKRIVVIGPFPPPIYGMSKNLQIVAEILSKNSNVTRICVSPGSIVRSKQYYMAKIFKGLVGTGKLLFAGLTSRNASLYLPPDAGLGMYYSILFVTIGRLFKMKMFFHHRSFAYINDYNKTMALMVKIAGKNAVQIFLCKNMESKFCINYGNKFKSMTVSNAQHVDTIAPEQIKPVNNLFIVGHLSNLGFDKGLKDVFDLLERLLNAEHKVKLVLAGPPENNDVKVYLNTKLNALGKHVEYRGYVDKADKHKFFNEIDLFVFPSRYKNEAQPNVIFEANAHGVPVITLQRGCIDSDVNQENGVVLDPQKDFTQQAVPIIERWLASPEEFMNLKLNTLIKTLHSIENAKFNFNQMIQEIEK